MSRQSTAWLSAMSLLVFGLVSTVLAARCQADDTKDSLKVPAAKKVDTQTAAIAEARKVDLPLLEKADRAVIQEARPGAERRQVTLKKAAEIKELRQALKPSQVAPSAGKTAATITFYRGDRVLRKVWVFEGGEWGFERPGTSWTTGRARALWKVLQKDLK